MQFGFIDYLAWPYYDALAKLFPNMADVVKQVTLRLLSALTAHTTDLEFHLGSARQCAARPCCAPLSPHLELRRSK